MEQTLISPIIWLPILMICCISVGFVVGLFVFKKDNCKKCGKVI